MNTYKDFNDALDQKKLLDECIFVVKEQSFYMKQSLENGSLRDTLKYASNMLCELRTSLLSPKYYYELYMLIFNELQHLDNFISDQKKHKKKFIDIYESVQHAGNIIPRLYLLIIVGRNYIKNKDIKAKYILKDMTELCKGIQHPLRGLFLRYFLIQMCKDRIPDTGSEYEEAGGGMIDDAFEFLLTNFYESLKLWSCMNDVIVKIPVLQDETIFNHKKKFLKEKMDVKMLLGSILVRMSQLEGMTTQYYIEKCLPKILLYLSNLNDSLIQQYILESIVQVFSDECHLHNLETLLNAILKTNTSLDFKSILITLLKRLRSFVESNKYAIPDNIDIFNLFYDHLILYINKTIDLYNKYTVNPIQENTNNNMLKSIDVGNTNTDNAKDVDSIITQNNNNFTNKNGYLNNIHSDVKYNVNNTSETVNIDECVQNMVQMLQVIYEFIFLCIRIYDNVDINKLFALPYIIVSSVKIDNDLIWEQMISIIVLPYNYLDLNALHGENMYNLLNNVNEKYKKKLSLDIIDAIIECKNKSIAYQDVEQILKYISPIFHDKEKNDDVFNLGNNLSYTSEKICKFVHIITNNNEIEHKYNICMLFYKYVANSSYLIHILPTIIFSMLNIVSTITNLASYKSNIKEYSIYDLNEEKSDEMTNQQGLLNCQNDISEKKIIQYNNYVKSIFKFIHTNLLSISSKMPILTFKLFLYSAVAVNRYSDFVEAHHYINFDNLEAICYEFITQPLIIYEEDINISSQQFDCIIWTIGILSSHITLLENENYDNIALKLTQHANKLLKKKDQCIGVSQCFHLYMENKKYLNMTKAFECLQKSIKNADIAMQSNSCNTLLFVYILKKYVYYYDVENIKVADENFHYLMSMCHDYYKQTNNDTFKNEYKHIVKYIQEKKKKSNQSVFHKIIIDPSILYENN